MFKPHNKFTPQEKQLIVEYMDSLCNGLTRDESEAVFMLSIVLAASGIPLSDPATLKALEVITSYVTFMQGLEKN